jgi:hypothetical protein
MTAENIAYPVNCKRQHSNIPKYIHIQTWIWGVFLACSWNLNKWGVCFSETSVNFYGTTWHCVLGYSNTLHSWFFFTNVTAVTAWIRSIKVSYTTQCFGEWIFFLSSGKLGGGGIWRGPFDWAGYSDWDRSSELADCLCKRRNLVWTLCHWRSSQWSTF